MKTSSQKKSRISGGQSLGQSHSKPGKSQFGSDDSEAEMQEDEQSDEEYDGGVGDLPSQPAMKRELI